MQWASARSGLKYFRKMRRTVPSARIFSTSALHFARSCAGSAFFDIVVRELGSGWAGRPAPVVVLRSGVYIAFDHGLYAGMAPSPPPVLEPALELWAHVLSRPEPGLALACAGQVTKMTAGVPAGLSSSIMISEPFTRALARVVDLDKAGSFPV